MPTPHMHLGNFTTAEEAALAVARNAAAHAAAAQPPARECGTRGLSRQGSSPTSSREEMLRQAEAEGLILPAWNGTGYKNVLFDRKMKTKPYRASGKHAHLGTFATAEDAALAVARDAVAQAVAPQPPSSSSRKRKAKSEEQPPNTPDDVVVVLDGQFVAATGDEELEWSALRLSSG